MTKEQTSDTTIGVSNDNNDKSAEQNDILVEDSAKRHEISATQCQQVGLVKTYLETEIDSYPGSGYAPDSLGVGMSEMATGLPLTHPNSSILPSDHANTNPFSNQKKEPIYTKVEKTNRPAIPPKPILLLCTRKNEGNINEPASLPDYRTSDDISANSTKLNNSLSLNSSRASKVSIPKVTSLPNLQSPLVSPENDKTPGHLDIPNSPTLGYGRINKSTSGTPPRTSLQIVRPSDPEYCEVLPDSPPYVNQLYENHNACSDPERIYEDVAFSNTNSEFSSPNLEKISQETYEVMNIKDSSDYVPMEMSPISEIKFNFAQKSLYDSNTVSPYQVSEIIPPKTYQNIDEPNRTSVYQNVDDINCDFEATNPLRLSTFKPELERVLAKGSRQSRVDEYDESRSIHYENVLARTSNRVSDISSSSSITANSSSLHSSKSMASTTASSFQSLQVCYFPPAPPKGFFNPEYAQGGFPSLPECPEPPASPSLPGGLENEQKINDFTDGSLRTMSKSKIPVRVPTPSQSQQDSNITVPDAPAPPLPATPAPSPAPRVKNKRSKKLFKLSPPSPPSGKSMRWYERMGCIQSNTLQPSEPYGLPGERRRSKSLSKDSRKSQFFVSSSDISEPKNQNDDHLI